MTWKDDFNQAVLEYVNKNYNAGAVEILDVYDSAWAYENSIGGSEVDYNVDISYKTEHGGVGAVTYTGRFSSLIEDLTS